MNASMIRLVLSTDAIEGAIEVPGIQYSINVLSIEQLSDISLEKEQIMGYYWCFPFQAT